jgi:hypothetical protein
MDTFTPAFDAATRQSLSDDLLNAYRATRMNATSAGAHAEVAKALLDDAIQHLALLRLVFAHTQRSADLQHLDDFAHAVLKPDEVHVLEQSTQAIESRARISNF